jgi:hypothetical protein
LTSQTAGASTPASPTVSLGLAPTTISAGDKTILYVAINNPTNTTFSSLTISAMAPPDWSCNCTPVNEGVLGSGGSVLDKFQISSPASASQGTYLTYVRVGWNQTFSAVYSSQISVQFLLGPSLPGDIPFALAILLLPGFVAFAIGVYLGGAKFEGRSAIQIALMSFLLGALIWQTGKGGIPLSFSRPEQALSPLFDTSFLTGSLQNIWLRTVLVAAAIAAAARIANLLTRGFGAAGSYVLHRTGGTLTRWIRGYDELHVSAWEAQTLSSLRTKKGYRRKVRLSADPQNRQNPQNQKESAIEGLFVAADKKEPFTVILDPQYVVRSGVTRDFIAASTSWYQFCLRHRIKNKKNPIDLDDLLSKHGDLVEKALQRAFKKKMDMEIDKNSFQGRVLVKRPINQWLIYPKEEPIAKFLVEGKAIPSQAPYGNPTWVTASMISSKAEPRSEKEVQEMMKSLNEQGQLKPIEIDEKGTILDGQLRWQAIRKLWGNNATINVVIQKGTAPTQESKN